MIGSSEQHFGLVLCRSWLTWTVSMASGTSLRCGLSSPGATSCRMLPSRSSWPTEVSTLQAIVVVMVAFSSHTMSLIHSPPALLFFKRKSTHTHQFCFFGQDQSIVAQQSETTVAKCSLMNCTCPCFSDRLPHYAWTALSVNSHLAGSRVYTCLG